MHYGCSLVGYLMLILYLLFNNCSDHSETINHKDLSVFFTALVILRHEVKKTHVPIVSPVLTLKNRNIMLTLLCQEINTMEIVRIPVTAFSNNVMKPARSDFQSHKSFIVQVK